MPNSLRSAEVADDPQLVDTPPAMEPNRTGKTRMNDNEQQAILTLSLMAAFADGAKDEAERAEIKRVADALAGEGTINLAALYQDVLLKRVSLASAANLFTTPEARQLAFAMAVCACNADGVQSAPEQAYLADLRRTLALDAERSTAYIRQADTFAAAPMAAASDQAVVHASTMSPDARLR